MEADSRSVTGFISDGCCADASTGIAHHTAIATARRRFISPPAQKFLSLLPWTNGHSLRTRSALQTGTTKDTKDHEGNPRQILPSCSFVAFVVDELGTLPAPSPPLSC